MTDNDSILHDLEVMTLGEPCRDCGGTECICADCATPKILNLEAKLQELILAAEEIAVCLEAVRDYEHLWRRLSRPMRKDLKRAWRRLSAATDKAVLR